MTWKEKYGPLLMKVAALVVAAIVGALGSWLGIPPDVVEKIVQSPSLESDAYIPTTGWIEDPTVIEANLDPAITTQFAGTPAGRAVLGDDDVFLWQAVRKVNNRGPPWYPNVDQKSVGCCVGTGFKHCSDVVQATAILSGARYEWKPISAEVIYGGSRVEIGGGRISGDGSIGAWAARWVREWGMVPMEVHGDIDLSQFSPSRARDFGRRGVPDPLETLAREHPVKGTALVKSWTDVKRAVQQGYPVAVCSNQGFRMDRDRGGWSRPQGRWNHCMAIIGIRSGDREGGFILNSWGDRAHTGPVWPDDAPVAGFWAESTVIDRMVRQGDSFALADVHGFPARKVPDDWFIHAAPRPARRDIFVHLLKPDWSLSP